MKKINQFISNQVIADVTFSSRYPIKNLQWFFFFGFLVDLLSKSPFLENNFINQQITNLLESFLSPLFLILGIIFFGLLYTFGSAFHSDQNKIKTYIEKTIGKIELYSAPIIGVAAGFAVIELSYKLTAVPYDKTLLSNTVQICLMYYLTNFLIKLFYTQFDDFKNHSNKIKTSIGIVAIGVIIFSIKSTETSYTVKIKLSEQEYNQIRNKAENNKVSMQQQILNSLDK